MPPKRQNLGPPVDGTTGALVQIEQHKYLLQAGKMYSASLLAETLSDDGNLDFAIAVSSTAGEQPHITFDVAGGGDGYVFLYESASVAGGVSVTPRNMNRAEADAAASVVTRPNTVSAVGTTLNEGYMPMESGVALVGGNKAEAVGWQLKAGRTYMIRLTNKSGGAIIASVDARWHEG